jgi:hypothetical protein
VFLWQCIHIGLAGDDSGISGYNKLWATPCLGNETKDDKPDDPYDLELWHYGLYSHWALQFTATLESSNEAEVRSGTDYLFQLAFQQRSEWKHHFK